MLNSIQLIQLILLKIFTPGTSKLSISERKINFGTHCFLCHARLTHTVRSWYQCISRQQKSEINTWFRGHTAVLP